MKKIITLALMGLVLSVHAQVFNRSLPYTASNDHPVITHHNGNLIYADIRNVQELSASGVPTRTAAIPDSLPQAQSFHGGIFNHPSGSLMLYGYYHEGCDVLLDRGYYIYELNHTFSWGRTKVQSAELAGVVDLIALDNNRLFMLAQDGYAVLNGTTLDTLFTGPFPGSFDVRQALYLGGDDVLIESRTWASAQPVQLQVNLSTKNLTYTGITNGYHFDINDTLIGVFVPAKAQVTRYHRFTQIAVDSVVLQGYTAGTFMDVSVTDHHLILYNSNDLWGYAFPDMDSVGAYAAYNTSGIFIGRSGQLSTTASGTVALGGPYVSYMPLESGVFGGSHAAIFEPLALKATSIGARVTHIDTNGYHLTGFRGVGVASDWEITLYNNSAEVLDSFRLMHNLEPSYYCGIDYGVSADTAYTVQPGDSVKIQVYDVPSGLIRISGTSVTPYFEVNAVMANGRQVKAPRAIGTVTLNNVGMEEFASQHVEFYPNPARHLLHIQAKQPWQKIELISLQGKHIRSYTPSDAVDTALSLEGVSPGIYLVHMIFEQGRSTQKLVVQ
jgi:hypothetical protein